MLSEDDSIAILWSTKQLVSRKEARKVHTALGNLEAKFSRLLN